ncbi:MAG: hypothetical protein K9K40_05550 [Desulfotignum sp.]|nr:hypothetical protein [Desulfotignum sp.]MCF8126542.1 hypothetical protein [Desulfotignum sp.]
MSRSFCHPVPGDARAEHRECLDVRGQLHPGFFRHANASGDAAGTGHPHQGRPPADLPESPR